MSKITVQGINVEVTDSLKAHVEEQFSKLFGHYETMIIGDVEVKIEVDKHHDHLNIASVKVPISGNDIVIEGNGDDMYQLLTELQQKASRKMRKIKEKAGNKRHDTKRRTIEE